MDVTFEIVVSIGSSRYKMRVFGSSDGRNEKYVVSAHGKSVTFLNDIPYNQSKMQRHWSENWRLESGSTMSPASQVAIIQAIKDYFDPPPPPKRARPTPNNLHALPRTSVGGKYRSGGIQ